MNGIESIRENETFVDIGFLDLVNLKSIEKLLLGFHKITGLAVALFDDQDNQLIKIGWKRICTEFHRKNNQSLKNCHESDHYFREHKNINEPIEYRCKNGLYDVAFPIFFHKKHLATIYFGQFLYNEEKRDKDYFLQQAEIYNYNAEKYLKALEEVPVFSKAEIKDILDFYTSMVYNIINAAFTRINLLEEQKKKSDRLLKQALEYNEKITQTSPVGIVAVNKNAEIEYANNRAEETLGLTKDDIKKLTYNAPQWKIKSFDGGIFPERDLPFNQVRKSLTSIYNIRHAIEWPDGSMAYLSINASPRFDENHEFDGMVATLENITDQVKAEKEKKRNDLFQEAIIKNAAEGLCVCYNCEEFPFVNFTVWSDQMTKITGYTMDEINKQGWYQSLFKDPEIQQKAIQRMSAMQEGDDIVTEEWSITTKDNTNKTISISASVILEENSKTHVMALITDTTVKRKYTEAIENHNKELKRLNDTKDKFLSIISHDLKGPIGSQVQLLEILIETIKKKSIDEIEQYILKLYEQSKVSYELMDNLLNWAKSQIGSRKIKPEKFVLKELVDEVTDHFTDDGKNKQINIYNMVKQGTLVFADKSSIQTVLRNLISNSIKFTKPGGKIKISSERIKNMIYIKVEDNGVGMSKSEVDTLFQMGETKSKTGTKNEKGSGLGLLICKELVSDNHGEIWAESEYRKGSTFIFSLPVSKQVS